MTDKPHEEWLAQADYDLAAAEAMLSAGFCVHAAFTCHLAVEKAMKGLFQVRLQSSPPKTHDLIRLAKAIGVVPPEDLARFLIRLNEYQIATR